jgi:hypothetical protein
MQRRVVTQFVAALREQAGIGKQVPERLVVGERHLASDEPGCGLMPTKRIDAR